MPRTRVFTFGESQYVRIPAEIAYADYDTDLEITRCGEVVTILPVRYNLRDAVATLRQMPKPAVIEKRESIETGSSRAAAFARPRTPEPD